MRNSKFSRRSSSGAHKTEPRTGADNTHHPNTHRIRLLSATRPPGLQRSPSPGAAAAQPSLSAASRASSGSFTRADAKSPQTEGKLCITLQRINSLYGVEGQISIWMSERIQYCWRWSWCTRITPVTYALLYYCYDLKCPAASWSWLCLACLA